MRPLVRWTLALLLAALLGATPAAGAAQPEAGRATGACHRTLPSYPVLVPGDRSRAVRTLQCTLNDVGVGPVVVDGFYGPQTKAAVKKIVDGFEGLPDHPYRINNGFWVLLFARQLPGSALAVGANGKAVTVLQRALRAAGADLVVDGDFGEQTKAAVRAYQRAVGVRASGVVNERTRFFLTQGAVIGQLD